MHKQQINKKVLLRERKRHTNRSVTSTPYAVLSWGVPTLDREHLPWGTPLLTWPGGYLLWEVPTLARGYLPWMGSTYLGWGVPTLGVPPSWPAQGGVPTLGVPHLDLARVPPPSVDRLKTLPSPHPSDAVGNKDTIYCTNVYVFVGMFHVWYFLGLWHTR